MDRFQRLPHRHRINGIGIVCIRPTPRRPVKSPVLLIEEARGRMYVCIRVIIFRICSESGNTRLSIEHIDIDYKENKRPLRKSRGC